jgi:hypothetical protein
MSSNENITANITETSTIINNDDIEIKSKELLSTVLTKSLILVGMIALICVLIFIIGIILYCIIKKFRSNISSSPLRAMTLNKIMSQKPKNFEFRKLQNDSSLGNESNKVNVSLSEIRVKNLQLENNPNNCLELENIKKNKKKDDEINLNTGGNQVLSGSSSPGRDKKIQTKELVNNLGNSIDQYMFQENN